MRKFSLISIILIAYSHTLAADGVPGPDPALQQMQQQNLEAGHSSMNRQHDQQYNIRKHARPKPEQTSTPAPQTDIPAQPAQAAVPVENCFTNPKMSGCMTKEELDSLSSPSTTTRSTEQ